MLLVSFPVFSQLIVLFSFFRIAQYFIGFICLLEFFFRGFISRIFIRMIFHRQLAECFLNFLLGGGFLYAEDFVIIFVIHSHPKVKKCTRMNTIEPGNSQDLFSDNFQLKKTKMSNAMAAIINQKVI